MKKQKLIVSSFLVCAATLAFADKAIVVGINEYPGIQKAALRGAVADSSSIATALKKAGFEVSILQNSQATRSGILKEFEKIKSSVKSNERFVFFFAGHGWKNQAWADHAAIVPYDANDTGTSPEIRKDELTSLVKSVPAQFKSILLDSCFSGNMASRALRFDNRLVARSIERADSADPSTRPSQVSADGIVFFTACSPEELAYEAMLDGTRRGLFSYNLEKLITNEPNEWSSIVGRVNGEVKSYSRSIQNPMLLPASANTETFLGETGKTPRKESISDLWNLLCVSASDPNVVKASVVADRDPIQVQDGFRIRVESGRSGYIAVLHKGSSGKFHLLYPRGSDLLGSATVAKGQSITVPGGEEELFSDVSAVEHVKVIHYQSKESLEALLKAVGESGFLESGARDLQVRTRDKVGTSLFTFDLTIPIEPTTLSSAQVLPRLGASPASTQQFRMGCEPTPALVLKRFDRLALISRTTLQKLPPRVMLSQYLPPVGDQGNQGSCTAWAVGYYMYSYALNKGRMLKPSDLAKPEFLISPAFLYNQINRGRDNGSSIAEAVEVLVKRGAASLAEMPYSASDFLTQPTETSLRFAERDRAEQSMFLGSNGKIDIDLVKAFLANEEMPVAFGMKLGEKFFDTRWSGNLVYDSETSYNVEGRHGNHAMCIVGYDDSLKAFRVVNSWGSDWGDKGFLWISYDLIQKEGWDCFGMVPGGLMARTLNSKVFKIVPGEK